VSVRGFRSPAGEFVFDGDEHTLLALSSDPSVACTAYLTLGSVVSMGIAQRTTEYSIASSPCRARAQRTRLLPCSGLFWCCAANRDAMEDGACDARRRVGRPLLASEGVNFFLPEIQSKGHDDGLTTVTDN
jgi:hypothetical protein